MKKALLSLLFGPASERPELVKHYLARLSIVGVPLARGHCAVKGTQVSSL